MGFAERAHALAVLGLDRKGGWVSGCVVRQAVGGHCADVFWCGLVGAAAWEQFARYGKFALGASRDVMSFLVAAGDVDVSGGFRRNGCTRIGGG